jgi:CheY-like chemotaxis protein
MNGHVNRRVLCVDDEANVLDAFRRTLRRDFEISVADGGEVALSMLASERPFAVVLSDMRMPGMDGIELLSRVKEIAPDSVRMMLTGNSDQQTAMEAVNAGSVFRFMTKPCSPEEMIANLNAGVEQYRLITAEKQLLEQTLNQSLQVMLDILSIVNPTAFSRSGRVKKLARELGERLEIERIWELEFAAMLSQIGCVAVPEEILEKIAQGQPLSNRETALYSRHPEVGRDLINRIPRMENVSEIIANQNRRFSPVEAANDLCGAILHAVLDHDRYVFGGMTPELAFSAMRDRSGNYDPRVLTALDSYLKASTVKFENAELPVTELQPGMYLDKPLLTLRGSTLLPAGQEITSSLILRLMNLVETGMVGERIKVSVPAMNAATAAVLQGN